MSPHVLLMLSGMIIFFGGLGTMVLQQKEPPPPQPISAPERPRETWDVFVRLYLPNAAGRLEEIGGYMLKHSADKAAALAEVEARNSQPEALDAEVKAFLLKYEFPPNVLYAVQAQRASGGYSVVSKYRAPILSEAPQ